MKHASYTSWFAITLLLWASSALAEPLLEVRDAWVQATVPGQPVAGAYMTLRSPVASRLVAVSSNVSKSADVHSMSMDNGVMRMRQVKAYDIPAGRVFELSPGGAHLMLVDLKAPLKQGTKVPLTLRFEKGGEIRVELEVRALGAHGGHMH